MQLLNAINKYSNSSSVNSLAIIIYLAATHSRGEDLTEIGDIAIVTGVEARLGIDRLMIFGVNFTEEVRESYSRHEMTSPTVSLTSNVY